MSRAFKHDIWCARPNSPHFDQKKTHLKGFEMIDTHWIENPKLIEINYNDTTEILFMLYDLKSVLSEKTKDQPLNDSDDSVGEAIDHAIKFIEKIDKKFTD